MPPMNRTELVHTIARVIHQHRFDGFTSGELAVAILDKIEPMIRTDERQQNKPLYTAALMQHMQDRLDLRAEMEALRDELKAKAYAVRDTEGWGNIMLMADGVQRALDLFDGVGDEPVR